jgi:hypothetical protein
MVTGFVSTCMRRLLAGVLATLIGFQPALLGAPQAGRAATPPVGLPQPPQSATPPPPSVESLGVSFDRIKRQLGEKRPTANTQAPLKLEYYVEVIAEAPPFQLFAPDEPSFGPVPGGAPTHADMVRHVTPLAFSAPTATLVSFGGKGGSPKVVGYEFWKTQEKIAQEMARRRKLEEERERQRKLKESVVVTPPKGPGMPVPQS